MSDKNLLRILTLFDNSEEAEALINILRNAGQIIRDIRVEDEEDLQTALDENPIDILLSKKITPIYSAKQAVEFLRKTDRDLPLIVITDPGKPSEALDELQAGARDMVAIDQPELLRHIVDREISDLNIRRAYRRNEQMLLETEKRTRYLIDQSRDAIAYVHDGMHIYANSAYLKMFGYEDLEEIEGVPILDMVGTEDHPVLKDFLRKYAKGQNTEDTIEVEGKQVNGNSFNIFMEFSRASMEGESCSQIIIRDHSDSEELEKRLHSLSKQDLLTNLYNRTHFLEQINKLLSLSVEGKAHGVLMFISIDKFDTIRETVDISGADLLLADIAELLTSHIGNNCILARYEGPVFSLLLHNIDIDQAEEIANTLCLTVSEHTSDINGKIINPTASIGIMRINETISNSQECISRVEKGRRAAQQAGGNQYSIYNPAIAELAEKEQVNQWAFLIKEALKQNRFRLAFQPIVSLHGEPGAHYEVLVRMIDKNRKELQPAEFMSVANDANLTKYIDRWVIANVFKLLLEREKQGLSTRFFVKVSESSLIDPAFIPWLSERIQALQLATENLVFELDEDTALNHIKPAKQLIEGLQKLGCRTALHNFGVENNTLESLMQLKVNYIKLHYELIHNLAQSVENQEKVKVITNFTSEANILAIASFVEDANSLALLWQCRVDFIQGHFLQQPNSELNYSFDDAF
ncbi:hypothetical protein MNBD_GAMMA25-1262 [hydrothermal vent metagenome]|uniref:Uncharacterized protein n=1 Tax=hydrothermal vent metagenome TaxID=652676 RepID=A0A3B1AUS9_9ZZZZ